MKELTQQQAIDLAETEFYKDLTPDEIVRFQLFEPLICMPFDVFHEAIEKVLDRPVFVHEFASSNVDRIKAEFLGSKKPPTFQEIIDLIPEEKRLIVFKQSTAKQFN